MLSQRLKIALVGSRFTHTAESRYAPVECEALSVAYALDHARHFVLGCNNLIVAVDHKPLLDVLGDRSLDIPNNRLRNLKEKTLRYRFRLVHIAGAKHKATDALSRRPVGSLNPKPMELPDDVSPVNESTTDFSPLTDFISSLHQRCLNIRESTGVAALRSLQAITWENVKIATCSDNEMQELLHCVESWFPPCRSELPDNLHEWFQHRDHLTTEDGVVLYMGRIVVPKPLRPEVLFLLHCAHQGTARMIARAEKSVYWPGISSDIMATRQACTACNHMAQSSC